MLKNRLTTGLFLGALFLGALFFLPTLSWALFLLIFIMVGAWEWGGLVGYSRDGKLVFLVATAAFALIFLPGMSGMALWSIRLSAWLFLTATLFWALLMPLWLAHRWSITGRTTISALIGWLLLLSPWVALISLRHINGAKSVLIVMLTVTLADSAAYFSGKHFGKHKMAPQISPGKTWEGLIGALVVVTLIAFSLCVWMNWSLWLVGGFLAIVILSVMGDLFESLIKRHAGKKDSGSILPGHGGVLDRIDGLTSTLPLVAFYLNLELYRMVLFAR